MLEVAENKTLEFYFFELCDVCKNFISDIQLYCSSVSVNRSETTHMVPYGMPGSSMRVVFLLNRLVAVKL